MAVDPRLWSGTYPEGATTLREWHLVGPRGSFTPKGPTTGCARSFSLVIVETLPRINLGWIRITAIAMSVALVGLALWLDRFYELWAVSPLSVSIVAALCLLPLEILVIGAVFSWLLERDRRQRWATVEHGALAAFENRYRRYRDLLVARYQVHDRTHVRGLLATADDFWTRYDTYVKACGPAWAEFQEGDVPEEMALTEADRATLNTLPACGFKCGVPVSSLTRPHKRTV
jgi:hypothetical protein